MWLLGWLSDRASKVLDWFGGFYWTARSRLSNYWSNLQTYAERAYRWAREWALPQILRYYYKARDWSDQVMSSLRYWVKHRIAEVSIWLQGRIEGARSLAVTAYNEASRAWENVRSRVYQELSQSAVSLRSWSLTKLDAALKPFSWVTAAKEGILRLTALFSEERRQRLILVLDDYFAFLLALATRPLQTILSFVQPIFLELLTFTIAYALGTEEAELPAWPDWSGGFGGPLPGPSVPPPVVKRDLVAPLARLRVSGYRYREGHRALDLGLANGTEVFAMHAGTVEYIGFSGVGYGNQLTLGGGSWWTRYAHLQRVLVRRGQRVEKGQLIAYGDDTGNSTGPHLHLEIKFQGAFVDPETILF